jgi:hypothetical protein
MPGPGRDAFITNELFSEYTGNAPLEFATTNNVSRSGNGYCSSAGEPDLVVLHSPDEAGGKVTDYALAQLSSNHKGILTQVGGKYFAWK